MRVVHFMRSAIALTSCVYAQTASIVTCDSITTICYSSYLNSDTGISYGIALPMNVTEPYDAIISITSPVSNPWAGFAWGGTMVFNPLVVAWPNGLTSVVSSRFAFGFNLPQAYDGAEYTLMKGTIANSTHWTMTARCRGCTSYQDSNGDQAVLNGTGTVQFGWAQGGSAVQEPANNNSAFSPHKAVGHWTHDLNAARNPKFEDWVSSNLLTPAVTSSSAPATSTITSTRPLTTLSTAVISTSNPTTSTTVGKIPATCSGAGAPVFSSVVATGWKATKVLGGLTNPRDIIFDSAGNILLIQNGKGITVHAMTADGCVSTSKTLVAQNNLNHAIQLSADEKTLYASSANQVYSWPYTASSATVGTRNTIVNSMYNGIHTSRTLLISPKTPNLLVVSHGSNDNWDYGAGDPKIARACIKVFDLNKIPSGGYNWVTDGWLVGYGLRNEVGITVDGNNMLWGVENSSDDLTRTINGQKKDVHQNNPGEKLNYLGDITVARDQWFGYPTCFAVWQPSDFTDTNFQVGDPFVIAPNATFTDATCRQKIVEPSLVFQAHSAPIDSKFDDTFSNLYVTFHGSWDRSPTTGFKVVAVPFTKGSDGLYRPVAPVTSNTGYTDIFWNPDVTRCAGNGPVISSGCFRPAGLGFNQGRLYMTSDTSNGELWVLGKS